MTMNGHFYIFATIVFTVYGQLILKWRIAKFGALPQDLVAKVAFLVNLLIDPLIFSGLLSAFLAAMCWMAAMTQFELSYAYPFMGLTFVANFLFAVCFLNEPFTWQKLVGNLCILLGVIFVFRR